MPKHLIRDRDFDLQWLKPFIRNLALKAGDICKRTFKHAASEFYVKISV